MGACGRRGSWARLGGGVSDPLTCTLNTAPGNGSAKMGTTILGAPLEATGRGKGELKQSPSYRDTKAAPGVAYGAHKGAQGRTRAETPLHRHTNARQARGHDE